MSVRKFAETIGVSEGRVRKRIKDHARIEEAVFPDGSLDPDEARALWYVDLDVSQMRAKFPQGDDDDPDALGAINFNRLKADRMAVDLEAAKINLENLKKTTVDRDVAKRAVKALMRLHRDTIINFANRYGPAIAAELGVDGRTLMAALDRELRNALNMAAETKLPFHDD